MTLEQIIDVFGARRSGKEWIALCPVHGDRNPSLSITEKSGKILFNCRSGGCKTEDILAAKGLSFTDLGESKSNGTSRTASSPRRGKARRIEANIAAIYQYSDEDGVALYQKVRYEEPGREKDFGFRRPNGTGGWDWSLNGTRRVLYCLRGVRAAEAVLIVEGEKDVETALRLGFPATCNDDGAGKWRDEYSEKLRGKHVVIIPDDDEQGRKHAQLVATSLHLRAASIKIVELPDAKDLTEWVEQQSGDAAFLRAFINRAPIWNPDEPAKDAPRLGSCSTAELFQAQQQEVAWKIWPIVAPGLAVIIDALPKVGKTVLLLHGILASRRERPFLNYATKRIRVCYVSEQSRASLAMQAREIGFTGDDPIEELRWITREDWSRYIYTDFLAALEKEIIVPGKYDALVIDTFHTVARMEDEKDASEVNRLGNLTIDVATRNGMALTMGRHDRKSGGDIGISGRSSIQLSGLVDVILHLVRQQGQTSSRKLELLGRVPGLPTEQTIDLVNGVYINFGEPVAPVVDRVSQVAEWLREDSELTGEAIVAKFAALDPPVKISVATARRYRSQYQEKAKP